MEQKQDEIDKANKEMRPKRNQIVEFKVNGMKKIGKVIHVGKAGGKDKNRCWIKLRGEDNKEESYDFIKEVATWKAIEKVTFSNQTVENRTTPSQRMECENDSHGIWFLSHKHCCVEDFDNPDDINEVFATNIPSKQHHLPDAVAAKEKELEKWSQFEAAEEIEYTGKECIIQSVGHH